MPRIEFERLDIDEDLAETDGTSFDRIAFTERALALVRPPRTTVAVCEGSRRVRVSAGREWGGAPDARWAIVSVPRNASRRAIASALLELTHGTPAPWSLDVLMNLGDES